MNYDVIGDIHGHADKLTSLLKTMGYRESGGAWRLTGHTAIFVGDFIDRGNQQVECVDIVRRMVDANTGLAVMGNHELNAIAWHTPDPESAGAFLRSRTGAKGKNNLHQHQAFLDAVQDTPAHDEIISWFKGLPLWLDLPQLRVVHACWSESHMRRLTPELGEGLCLTEELLHRCHRKDNWEFDAVEILLKGVEIPLPAGHSFKDKSDVERYSVRLRWWDPEALTYSKAAIMQSAEQERGLPEMPIPKESLIEYDAKKPVFFGHYWMKGAPKVQQPHAACVDYSAGANGPLVAYRWGGEAKLMDSNLVSSSPA